ncbi:MAG: SDR family oxidoreductase [Burkholderiaceae bacterium]|nr:SDR family oxidoreductase [Microbacteriaceae bacterium]
MSDAAGPERPGGGPDPFRIDGHLAVVTGVSRGIGLEIARALARAGADIVGVSATIAQGPSEARSAVEAEGRRFLPIAADFSDRDAVSRLAASLAGMEADILVNNGGTIRRAPAAQHSDADWDHVIDVNLRSQFVLARELGRGFVERRRGRVIFLASMLSFQGGVNVPGYTASKSAITGLTKALANEWAASGVTVNAIAPGYISTDNTAALRNDPGRSDAILTRIPAGRWGAPSDIGGAAVFLASPASAYVNGITLPVDGGWLAR